MNTHSHLFEEYIKGMYIITQFLGSIIDLTN